MMQTAAAETAARIAAAGWCSGPRCRHTGDGDDDADGDGLASDCSSEAAAAAVNCAPTATANVVVRLQHRHTRTFYNTKGGIYWHPLTTAPRWDILLHCGNGEMPLLTRVLALGQHGQKVQWLSVGWVFPASMDWSVCHVCCSCSIFNRETDRWTDAQIDKKDRP